jgi:hypothetical protein
MTKLLLLIVAAIGFAALSADACVTGGTPPQSFTLSVTGGETVTYTFTNPTFQSTFPDLTHIYGNVATAQTAQCPNGPTSEGCWYSSQNRAGQPNYGAVICCGTATVGIDNSEAGCSQASGHNPYSILPGQGLRVTYWSGCGIGTMTSAATDGTGFRQKFGYFEIKTRLSSNNNVWNSFWALNGLNDWRNKIPGSNLAINATENDFFEQYGNACGPINTRWSQHSWTISTAGGPDTFPSQYPSWPNIAQIPPAVNVPIGEIDYPSSSDYATAYHTYGVLIDNNWLTYYLDRVQVMQGSTYPEARDIIYMVISLSINNFCPSGGTTPSPSSQDVAYVKVWQLNQ